MSLPSCLWLCVVQADSPLLCAVRALGRRRVSQDIAPQFFSAVYNINRALPYLRPEAPLSRPGCWAYPDMLEVGVTLAEGATAQAMTHTESRTHFAMWAVTSAPLILSIDLADAAVVEANWDIIANREVIRVSQTWSGHPGYLVQSANKTFVATCVAWTCENHTLPEYQIWAKPQPNGALAVLVVNIGAAGPGGLTNLTVPLSELFHPAVFEGGEVPTRVHIRDVWKHAEVPPPGTEGGWVELVVPDVQLHDGMFVLLSPA